MRKVRPETRPRDGLCTGISVTQNVLWTTILLVIISTRSQWSVEAIPYARDAEVGIQDPDDLQALNFYRRPSRSVALYFADIGV